MKFHLNHIPQNPGFTIDHSHSVFLTGSCFSDNIGTLLQQHSFKTVSNPGGIIFNPLSIAHLLSNILDQKELDAASVLQRGELFYSFDHHSSLNDSSFTGLISKWKKEQDEALTYLRNCDVLFITFGSAYYYTHLALNKVVANCHKQPGNLFEKRISTVDQIVECYTPLLKKLTTVNPKLKIVFTVSPVKHLRDGLVENNLSKSTLILSVHELLKTNNTYYFPAFELINDDLRDYRFYKKDLAHPNEQAIDYVWEKFSECFFSEQTRILNQKIHKLNLAVQHRSNHKNADEAAKLTDFIASQQEEIKKINPNIVF